jgi:hypothetical protein
MVIKPRSPVNDGRRVLALLLTGRFLNAIFQPVMTAYTKPISTAPTHMETRPFPSHDRLLVLVLAALTLFRLYYGTTIPLSEDEAGYWQWARHLDWGYYDQGPMVAYFIRLGIAIFGSTELGVRAPAVLLMLGTSILLYRFCVRIFKDAGLGFWLVLAANGTVFFTAGAVIHTYDIELVFFWMLSLYLAGLAVFDNRPKAWYWCGIACGAAMLSKYTAVMLPLLLLIFLAATPKYRFWLKRKEPWVGAILAALIMVPNMYWNATHLWITFKHSLFMAGGGGWKFTLFEFLGAQAGLLGPILFVLLIIGLVLAFRQARKGDTHQRFLLWTSAPVLLLFLVFSIKTRVYGNWTAPGYLAAILAAGWALRERVRRPGRWRKWAIAGLIMGYLLVGAAHFHVPILKALDLDPDADPTMKLYGWPQLGQAVGQEMEKWTDANDPFVFGLRYQKTSLAAFYTPGQPETHCLFLPGYRLNAYIFWTDPSTLAGRDALAVVHGKPALGELFERFELVRELELTGPTGKVINWATLYRCYGFKGRDYRPDEYLAVLNRGKK